MNAPVEVRELAGAEADDVIRSSGWGYLDEKPHVWPACCGLCGQGKRICATPEACQMAVDDDGIRSVEALGRLLLLAGACVACAALLVVLS